MRKKTESIKEFVKTFLSEADKIGLRVEGDPEGLCFMVKDLRLGDFFEQKHTNVIVKFKYHNHLEILIPDYLCLRSDSKICFRFLHNHTFMKGWRQICPYLVEGITNARPSCVILLLNFITNPDLCGVGSCKARQYDDIGDEIPF